MATVNIDFEKVFDHYLEEAGLMDIHKNTGTYHLVKQTYTAGFLGAALIVEELIKAEYGNDPNRSVAIEICMRLQKIAMEAHDGKDNS